MHVVPANVHVAPHKGTARSRTAHLEFAALQKALVKKGTPLPAEGRQVFTTSVDRQEVIVFQVLSPSSELYGAFNPAGVTRPAEMLERLRELLADAQHLRQVFEGEDDKTDNNTFLGKFSLPVPPGPTGSVSVTVKMHVGEDSVLQVSAVDNASGGEDIHLCEAQC